VRRDGRSEGKGGAKGPAKKVQGRRGRPGNIRHKNR